MPIPGGLPLRPPAGINALYPRLVRKKVQLCLQLFSAYARAPKGHQLSGRRFYASKSLGPTNGVDFPQKAWNGYFTV